MPKGYNKKSKKRLKELIQKLIKELQKEDDLEEITITGDVEGYNTPNAFSGGRKEDEKKKKRNSTNSTGYKIAENIMKRVTVKEVKVWLKTLEENRYKRLVNADCRRIAWLINNSLSKDYESMPESMRKKWVRAEYKKERYMANKFLESIKQNESVEDKVRQLVRETVKDLMEARRTQFQIPIIDKLKVNKILKKLKLKIGKDYDVGVGKGATFILDIESKHLDKVVTLLMQNRIQVARI